MKDLVQLAREKNFSLRKGFKMTYQNDSLRRGNEGVDVNYFSGYLVFDTQLNLRNREIGH